MCEASLCDNHLRVHSKSPEHVLTDPSTNLEKRKCSVHKKVLEYYCTEDAACICVSCSLAGEHRGHQVEILDEASEKKKNEAMASADVRDELLCSICLTIYTDPVTLRCGHNFCRVCIDQVLNTQDESGVYSCLECRARFRNRPVLQRNITLRNVVERVRSTERHQEEITGICCTYCIHSPVPAVKSCLLCEASLCDKHLRVHSKSPEHVLCDPSTNLEKRKCSVHKKVLEYYCTEDAACICVSCSLAGEHRGHRVEILDEASEKKKKKLRNVLQKLITKRKKTEERVQSLKESRRKAQGKASGEAERVTALFIDIRRRLDDLEKKVLSEISRQEEQRSLSLSALIQKLEIKKAELSMKMRHIEELCNMTDPLTVLQDPDTGDLCDPEEGGGDEDTGGHDKTHDVDVDGITGMLHAGLSDIMIYVHTISPPKPEEMRPQPPSARSLPSHTQDLPVSGTEYGGDGVIVRTGGVGGEVTAAGEGGIYGQGPADILLDVNTAGNNIRISDDLKTATWTEITQDRTETAERFQDYPQVISIRRFTSGRHYWDVEIRESWLWRVGMCYPSIARRGQQSVIGSNNKSWGLYGGQWCNNQYSVIHDSKDIPLPHQISSNRFRICLDYEAGQLSFYELCDPIRHLHTFTDTFTESLHAALYVYNDSIKILGRGL
ncbi:E3 ubiquitin/ISG15 ligase TRIM25-like [Leptodactylus fuscus]|uniref:E3 ubiquitin/ISG15 ligase TRIM25-like n=1 Tax=Leptodactylus fuscus TaxID=238119 RepID=UPI003F4F13AD